MISLGSADRVWVYLNTRNFFTSRHRREYRIGDVDVVKMPVVRVWSCWIAAADASVEMV